MRIFGKHRLPKLLTLVLIILLSYTAGYLTRRSVEETIDAGGEIRLNGYQFINPLLECEEANTAKGFHELRQFKHVVQPVVGDFLARKAAGKIAVYFRDLKNGPWFGINEAEKFTPSSLMKVPLMMAILKRAEHDPALFVKKLKYSGREDMTKQQYFRPVESLHPGYSYAVDDLIFRMIAYSDNNATKLLAADDGVAQVSQLMAELGIPYDMDKGEDFITVRNYTSFFRVLFNSSYLNHDMSERALGYLARSTFEAGIRAGIPPDVVVASKFGEYSRRVGDKDEFQLSELGIVYYPDHPYLLGIVAKGESNVSLPRVLRDVSRTIYQEVDRQHRAFWNGRGQGAP